MVKKKTKVYLIIRNGVAYCLYFSAQVPMNDDIRMFIDNPNSLPQNYSIHIKGVKSRADVFIMLDFPPPTPHSVKKYPTKKNIIRYLENLGLTYYLDGMVISADQIDGYVKSFVSDYSYTKWNVVEYEVEVDHSMILRKACGNRREQYSEFIRRLFYEGRG